MLERCSLFERAGITEARLCQVLVKLDFSGCGSWLHSLSFLPELHGLRCLDLENVYMITDAWASYFIPGMRSLQALNMSGTNISDQFLEALTYGSRLQSWATGQELTTTSDRPIGMGSQQYHALDIIFLRLQHTKISEGVIPWLSSLNELKLLDVRFTDLPGRSLDGIKGILFEALQCLEKGSKTFFFEGGLNLRVVLVSFKGNFMFL